MCLGAGLLEVHSVNILVNADSVVSGHYLRDGRQPFCLTLFFMADFFQVQVGKEEYEASQEKESSMASTTSGSPGGQKRCLPLLLSCKSSLYILDTRPL